jgi:hypothetical protein
MVTEPRHDDLTSPVLMLPHQHPKTAELTLRCNFARAVSKGDRQLGDNIPCERGFANHASASATLPALHPMSTESATLCGASPGLGLEAQQAALARLAEAEGHWLVETYHKVGSTRARTRISGRRG